MALFLCVCVVSCLPHLIWLICFIFLLYSSIHCTTPFFSCPKVHCFRSPLSPKKRVIWNSHVSWCFMFYHHPFSFCLTHLRVSFFDWALTFGSWCVLYHYMPLWVAWWVFFSCLMIGSLDVQSFCYANKTSLWSVAAVVLKVNSSALRIRKSW